MDGFGASPKEQLQSDIKTKIDSVESRLRENDSFINQNELEVKRLEQQNSNVFAVIKRIEDNFDSIPREDIRAGYEKALDLRARLATMRNELEKRQSSQVYLREFRDKLQEVLDNLSGVTLDRISAGNGDQGFQLSLAGEQIVKLLEAQESERKLLATDLHDGPTQSLSNFILQAEICQKLFDRDPDQASKELGNLKLAASATFQKMREYIFELRPMMLDDLGLVATLRRHTETLSQKFPEKSFEFQMTGAGDNKRFPSHVEVMMFRTYQSLINNSLHVLNANEVTLRLDVDDNRLSGAVEDNGDTVDVMVVLDPHQSESPLLNIVDMRERIELVGGKLEFFSQEGSSNIAELMMPYEPLNS